ncbi:MAG: permease [Oscillospiraceae bacterium]|nr:permease [Oscillospiraceae bacterium]
METYIAGVLSSMLTTLFFVFVISCLGYMIGGIKVKGISLGTAGVLLAALAFGIFASKVGSFEVAGKTIELFNTQTIKPIYSTVSNIGTALFVTAVGAIAGPKFFRNFNKKAINYILMGFAVILSGIIVTFLIVKFTNVSSSLAVGLMTGALTSTPGLSAAKEVALDPDAATAGYGIAYLFGVLGVVLFVQIVPKLAKVDIEKERADIMAASGTVVSDGVKRIKLDDHDFFPFMLMVAFGMILGAIKIPGINFSLGTSGGTLVSGLIIGHFGHIGKIDLTIRKETLKSLQELGLMLFLVGAGVPGGVNFMQYANASYFVYGIIITTVPMIVGYLLGKYVFKLSIFNNLGSLTGGMTSTPALGTLISVAGTDDVAASYAATYPVALVMIVLAGKLLVMI